MKYGLLLVALFVSTAIFPTRSYGASNETPVPVAEKLRPRVKVTFDRDNFQVSYGQTIEFCMKVDPKVRFTPKITFASIPEGSLIANFGGSASCADASFSSIQVKSTTTMTCDAVVSLVVKSNNKPVATLPGAVILPTSNTGVFFQNHACSELGLSGPGGIVDWTIEVKGAAGANFDGVFADETLTPVARNPDTDPPSCGINPASGGRIIGETGPNQFPDNLGTCGTVLLPNCQSVFLQTLKVGACPAVQVNKLTFVFSSGNFFTKREDPTGSTSHSSPPIPP